MLQCPHAYILVQSLVLVSSSLSPSFSFSALPVVEGVGVTLTQFYHGGSHYPSDHFSVTHTVICRLASGLFTHLQGDEKKESSKNTEIVNKSIRL